MASPGKTNEHTDQRVITSSLGYAPQPLRGRLVGDIGADLTRPSLAYPEVEVWDGQGPIWHCSMSLPAGESLTDAQWTDVSQEFMARMGFEADSRWVAVGHGRSVAGNEHVHIAANLIRENGMVVNPYRDYTRASAVMNDLEHRYGLRVVAGRELGTGTTGLSAGELRLSNGKVELEPRIRAAAAVARDEAQFVKVLHDKGVDVAPRVEHGRVVGYSARMAGSAAKRIPGGKVAADLTLPKLRRAWAAPEPGVGAWTGTDGPQPEPAPDQPPRDTARLRTPNGPGEFIRATADLRRLETAVEAPGWTPVHAAAAHDVAGALSAISLVTEPAPGALAADARKVGGMAGKAYRPGKHRPPIRAALLFMAVTEQDTTAAQVVLFRQLISTVKAVKRAHGAASAVTSNGRGAVMSVSRELDPAMAQRSAAVSEAMDRNRDAIARAQAARVAAMPPTGGPPLTERERRSQMWDRDTVRGYRLEAERVRVASRVAAAQESFRPAEPMITREQYGRVQEFAKLYDLPMMDVASLSYTAVEAERFLGELERIETAMDPVMSYEQVADRMTSMPGPGPIQQATRTWAPGVQAQAALERWTVYKNEQGLGGETPVPAQVPAQSSPTVPVTEPASPGLDITKSPDFEQFITDSVANQSAPGVPDSRAGLIARYDEAAKVAGQPSWAQRQASLQGGGVPMTDSSVNPYPRTDLTTGDAFLSGLENRADPGKLAAINASIAEGTVTNRVDAYVPAPGPVYANPSGIRMTPGEVNAVQPTAAQLREYAAATGQDPAGMDAGRWRQQVIEATPGGREWLAADDKTRNYSGKAPAKVPEYVRPEERKPGVRYGEEAARPGVELNDPSTWQSQYEKPTGPQEKWLKQRGMTPEQIAGITKADASRIIGGKDPVPGRGQSAGSVRAEEKQKAPQRPLEKGPERGR